MKKIIVVMFVAAFLASCKNTKTTETQTAVPGETKTSATNTSPQNLEVNATASNETAADTGAKPALNPAHGEPYHRCDIAVGAPIDSPAPVQTAAPQVAQQAPANGSFNTNPIAPSAAPAPTVSSTSALGPKPAVNPAHGEPHHRCDLQVGAPLI